MKENQKIVVDIELSQDVLNENKDLNAYYQPESKQLVYELSGELPKEFVETLSTFMNTDVVGKSQLSVFNPLVVAVNEMQQLKKLEYDPNLSDEEIKEFAEQHEVSEIEIDGNEVYFDVLPSKLEKLKTPEAINKYNEKVHKALVRLINSAHNESYQDCKDAVKMIGAFNTSLNTAKKELKAPYSTVIKSIDGLYNIFKQESDNTKECVKNNFVEALNKEQAIKDAREEAKRAKDAAKIEELTEANKEQQEKLDNQSNAVKIAQEKNAIEYTDIGTISGKLAVEAPNLTKDALAVKLEELNVFTFDQLVKDSNRDISILNDEEVIALRQIFSENKTRWIAIVNREITLREEKEKAKANEVKLETIKETPSFAFSGSPDIDVPNNDTPVPIKETFSLENGTDLEKFEAIINRIEQLKEEQDDFIKTCKSAVFTDEEYGKRVLTLTDNSFPQISNSYIKIIEWANKFKTEYLNFLNNK